MVWQGWSRVSLGEWVVEWLIGFCMRGWTAVTWEGSWMVAGGSQGSERRGGQEGGEGRKKVT